MARISREGEEGPSESPRGEEPMVIHDEYGTDRMFSADRWALVIRGVGRTTCTTSTETRSR